ncbi:hypothetical protein D6817_05315 [Candidatus Pacearchaeota archaeon]|nr:MAG: hypothetical protein D6817_05315 [Candidatus Pacearchaeota archaeon]
MKRESNYPEEPIGFVAILESEQGKRFSYNSFDPTRGGSLSGVFPDSETTLAPFTQVEVVIEESALAQDGNINSVNEVKRVIIYPAQRSALTNELITVESPSTVGELTEMNGVSEVCDNDQDDDGDGAVDCADSDCVGRIGGPNDEFCESPEQSCGDGFDNDRNGRADCQDLPHCSERTGPNGLVCEACNNGEDDDGDGLADCADSDCFGVSPGCASENICYDNADNDADGLPDCLDDNCDGEQADHSNPNILCEFAQELSCNDGFDNDYDGAADCNDLDCQSDANCPGDETCDDGIDNDGDGLTDCADTLDCSSHPACAPSGSESECNDGMDNDRDGLADCADSDCASQPVCQGSEICDNGQDDDGDGLVDCADPQCSGQTGPGGICEATETSCGDGFDNDGDGAVDCADLNCVGQAGGPNGALCESSEQSCGDGFDNDGDGAVDCADSDCSSFPACGHAGTYHGGITPSNQLQ